MADDKDALKAIESDVVPLLEKIVENTKTRKYTRRTPGNQGEDVVGETVSTRIQSSIDSNRPNILAKRERVAKAELKTAIERKKAARAENGQFKSKSQEALKANQQKRVEAATQKSIMSRVGGIAGKLAGGKKGELGDAAGAAGAGVYYSAFREVADAIGELKDNDSGIVGFLKKKYNQRGDSKSQEALRKNRESESQERQRIAEMKGKGGSSTKTIIGGAEEGGGLIDDIVEKIFGKSKIGKVLGVGTGAAAGAGIFSKAVGAAKGGLGRLATGAGGMLARTSPWLAGGALAGGAGYGIGTLLNKGMGKLSGLVTGGKYEGDGWLGDATFDLVTSIKKLVTGLDENTEAIENNDPVTGVNFGGGEGVTERAKQVAGDTARSIKRAITGEEVATIQGSGELGGLSARYESGGKGSEAIGWDTKGGTSYGKYQIASKPGTMGEYLEYIKDKKPEAYARLKAAGPHDLGKNSEFANEWKKLAAEGGLGTTEHDFIKSTHFDKQFSRIDNKELRGKIENSKTLQDIFWSTSVQHRGNAPGIFEKSYKPGMSDEELVNAIYAERGTRFGGSTAKERASVQNRFVDESKRAQAMLAQEKRDKSIESLAGQQQSSPSQVAQQKPTVVSASVNKTQQAQPVSLQKENAKYSGALQNESSSMNGVEGKLDKLIAINEEMKQNAQKREGEKDVENSPNIPMEYDDATLVLMVHDRA